MRLFKSFASSSKSEWLDKVEADLRGKALEGLDFTFNSDINISPFYHKEDLIDAIDIPISHRSQSCLGILIKVNDEVVDNMLILDALEQGVGFVSIDVSDSMGVDFKVLLEGVLIDLIELRLIVGDDRSMVKFFSDYLDDRYEESIYSHCSVVGISGQVKLNSCLLIRHLPDSPNGSLSSFLRLGAKALEGDAKYDEYHLQIDIDHDYFLSITKVRAARLLWANLCTAYDLRPDAHPLTVEGVISKETLKEDQYVNMVALTQMGVSMLSAGVDILCLPPSDIYTEGENADSSFTNRISNNIFHIMIMEGSMDCVKDPARGSYFFDTMAVKMAEQVWQKFIINRK